MVVPLESLVLLLVDGVLHVLSEALRRNHHRSLMLWHALEKVVACFGEGTCCEELACSKNGSSCRLGALA